MISTDATARQARTGTGAARAIPLSVHLLALSLFAMGSAEFLMGGILPMIAADLRITLPAAGALISAFAVGALIGGPAFAILALRWPGRRTLFLSQMAFMAATVVSLLAQGYWSILTARFAMGLAYACFWAVAAAMAVQLSPPDRRAKALAIVVSGLTAAMVIGGPVGTFISDAAGWRGGFWAVVAVTAISAVAGLAALPAKTPGQAAVPDLGMELRAMKRPALWVAYATTMVTTAAYMGTFGYLGALLLDVSGVAAAWLPAVLTLFGVGAFVGLTIGGRTADHHPFRTLVTGTVGLILASAAMALFASHRGNHHRTGIPARPGGLPAEPGGLGSRLHLGARCADARGSHELIRLSGRPDACAPARGPAAQPGPWPALGGLDRRGAGRGRAWQQSWTDG